MTQRFRLPIVAATCLLTGFAGTAAAQTLYARHAPTGRTIEAVVNRTAAGQAKADDSGDAKIPLNFPTTAGKPSMDVNVFVDVCADLTRVIVVENGRSPLAPDPGCERRDVQGLYAVTGEHTLVVNVGAPAPTMLLIKGSYTPPAPEREGEGSGEGTHRPSPTGLGLYAGATWNSFRDVGVAACGTVTDCKPRDSGIGYALGGVYWITPWLGAEGGYMRPKQVTASGSGTGYRFDTRQKTDVIVIAGKLAAPLGVVRLYATAGMNYTQATWTTNETVDPKTITVNGVDQTIPGGTQSFELKTQGWSYLFGGGAEIWASRSVAIFGEFDQIRLKGDRTGTNTATATDGRLDDHLTTIVAGLRFRLGGK